ncbi:hypothetical protein [Helicobacter fennelliae]|uniref:hypothetical protein n=1 Tax=Helicobacter fennelliae TaxID=215 RepID=UPI000E17035E|nr:hypothetical protein [Helicobacter fennelliae]STP07460.1 Uncharacterised protein [Helicobacter fennelliae]
MPQDITTLTMPRIVIYAGPDYPQKEYERLKALLESGKREEVIHELKILYPKDSYLANLLANRLGIDIQKELGIIYHYQDSNYSTTAQITNENSFEIITQYDSFHDILEVIQNYSQYKGNVTDTLMAGISGIFGAVEKGAEKITELAGGKYQIAKYLFKAEGISVSATYGYGSNNRDMVKTAVSVGIELFGNYLIGLALEGVLAALGMTSIPAFVIVGAISALTAGILMNTQAGKDFINFLADDVLKPLIDSLESKLQSFFSMFDSNPLEYELVPNPTLSSKDYQSLIELLLNKNSNALDIDTLLHTFPNYLAYPTHSYSTKDSTNSSLSLSTPKDALPIHIKAQCFNHKKEALSNREIYVYSPNFYSFVDRAKSDENGFIEFHNAYVSSKMTNSDLYFVLNRYGLDEEQKDFHIKISPSKTIQPKDKQVGELLEQRLSFEKNIPKAITLNDNIKPNIKVNAIEYIPQEYNHNSFNSPLEHHLIESITLQAHYVLKDSHKKNIQGDEQSLLKESIQRYKHKTKWGYIVFDRDEEIEQTLKQVNKTQPLVYSKRFKELENIKGEIVNIPFKEEWENKQIRFFAYLWRANRDVGIDVEFEYATHFVNEAYYDKIIIKAKDDDSEMLQILYTPYHMDDPALQDMSAMFIPILRGLKIFSKFGSNTPKEPITWKKIEQRLDTLHNVKKLNLPRNKEAIYEVSSLKELRELKDEFTHGTYRLPDKIEAKGVREEYALRDYTNTIVQYRTYSNQRMSGGKPTIDIRTQTTHNGKQVNMIHKIHIRYTKIKKEDGTFIIKILEWFEK